MDFVRFIYQRKYTIIIFVLLSIIFTFPLFLETNRIGIVNWDLWLFYNEAARVNTLEYKQMPFWSPYSCGGNVLLAHPESQFFSPMTLLNLLYGTILGIKISI